MKISPWFSFLSLGSLAFALAACSASPSAPASSAPAPAPVAVAAPVAPAAPPAPVVMAQPAAPEPAPAPIVTVASEPPAPVADAAIDFDQQVKPFFQKYCYSCHDVEGKAAGIGFDNRAGILKTLKPGNSAESLLYNVLATRKMPQGRPRPTMAEIETIRQWIDEGAKVSDSLPATDVPPPRTLGKS